MLLLARQLGWRRSTLGGCEISTIDHMPGDGNSTSPTLRKLEPLPGEQRLEHLLQAAIDRAHHRHAAEQLLAEIDQRPADQVGGRKPSSVSANTATIRPEPGSPNGR